MKVVHEREKCIGCGACVAVCADFWEMKDDGKSQLKGSEKSGESFVLEAEDVGCCEEAANTCPVQCIKVE